ARYLAAPHLLDPQGVAELDPELLFGHAGLSESRREILIRFDVVVLPELSDAGVDLDVTDLDGELVGPRFQKQLAEHVREHGLGGLADQPPARLRILLAAQDLAHHLPAALLVI